MKRYNSPQDVKMRLDNSICLYKGNPVYVISRPDMTVELHYLLEDKTATVDSSDEHLDISSVPLGYCNDNRVPYYTRGPYRQQKQGVSTHNTVVKYIDSDDTTRPERAFNTAAFGQMVLGNYPTVGQAVDMSLGRFGGAAFDRRYAFAKTPNPAALKLKGRGFTLGVFFPKKDLCLLKPEYDCPLIVDQLKNFMNVEVLEHASD